jgi:hypothetical protein
LARQKSRFTHDYFYIRDEVLGPIVMRVATFFPFQTTYYLNGNSFIEQELNRAKIGFRKDDNAFLAVDDVAALQAAADKLRPAIIRERLDYWTLILGPKFSGKERKRINLSRNELCSNNLKDFGVKKGLDNLEAVREKFQAITSRFASFQAQWLNVHVDFPLLQRIALPSTIGSVRYPGIKIHETRIIRLMEVLLHGGTHVGGWTGQRDPPSYPQHLQPFRERLSSQPTALRSAQARGSCAIGARRLPLRLPPHHQGRGGHAALSLLSQTAVWTPCQQPLPSSTRCPIPPKQPPRPPSAAIETACLAMNLVQCWDD